MAMVSVYGHGHSPATGGVQARPTVCRRAAFKSRFTVRCNELFTRSFPPVLYSSLFLCPSFAISRIGGNVSACVSYQAAERGREKLSERMELCCSFTHTALTMEGRGCSPQPCMHAKIVGYFLRSLEQTEQQSNRESSRNGKDENEKMDLKIWRALASRIPCVRQLQQRIIRL